MQVQFLGPKDLLEDGITTHSSILAWRIPWTEEPGGVHRPQGHKESNMTEVTLTNNTQFHISQETFTTRFLLTPSMPLLVLRPPQVSAYSYFLWVRCFLCAPPATSFHMSFITRCCNHQDHCLNPWISRLLFLPTQHPSPASQLALQSSLGAIPPSSVCVVWVGLLGRVCLSLRPGQLSYSVLKLHNWVSARNGIKVVDQSQCQAWNQGS